MAGFRAAIELAQAHRLLNHGPVTLVSSAHGGTCNVMAASWTMPLDFDPPKIAVVIDANSYTRRLVDASGEFALNVPCRAMAQQVLMAGSLCGRDGDKFERIGLECFAAEKIGAPLVAGCVAWLECRVLSRPDNEQRHDLFLAEVVSAHADGRVFHDGRWEFSDASLRTLHYFGGGTFATTGETVEVALD